MEQEDLPIERFLKSARMQLLDTGTRNRLIHVNRSNTRSNSLNIVNELSDEIFKQLHQMEATMSFLPLGKDKDEDYLPILDLDEEDEVVEAIEDVSEDRLTDNFLEAREGPKKLETRLLKIATAARTAEEDQGINILYLSLGFLKWTEEKSSKVEREAPLVLIPVELRRNPKTSTFDILARGEEIVTNLPLAERLKNDFGIILPIVQVSDEWLPTEYFAKVREAVGSRENWNIDENGIQLGFFSFAKILMYHDLDPDKWPNAELTNGSLVKELLCEGFPSQEPLFEDCERLDSKLDIEKIIQVVDADASQTKVIEEVRSGNNLVVQGPPGTGKSQTITNVIASAVHDGKSVLFVAEKAAALNVVERRLSKAGLNEVFIELHSKKANKKAFVQELGRTLMSQSRPIQNALTRQGLKLSRDKLNFIDEILHKPSSNGDSAYKVMSSLSRLIGFGAPAPTIGLDNLFKLTEVERGLCIELIEKLGNEREKSGEPDNHPFAGVHCFDLQPPDLQRLKLQLAEAVERIDSFIAQATTYTNRLEKPVVDSINEGRSLIETLKALEEIPDQTEELVRVAYQKFRDHRFIESLNAGADYVEATKLAADRLSETAWGLEWEKYRCGFVKAEASFFSRFGRLYREGSKQLASVLKIDLPKTPKERRCLVDQILAIQKKQRLFSEDKTYLKSLLKDLWRGDRTPFSHFHKVTESVNEAEGVGCFETEGLWLRILKWRKSYTPDLEQLERQLKRAQSSVETVIRSCDLRVKGQNSGECKQSEDIGLDLLSKRFVTMSDNIERYAEWTSLNSFKEQLTAAGGGGIIPPLLKGQFSTSEAIIEFSYACFEANWGELLRLCPELKELANLDRHQIVAEFQKADRNSQEVSKYDIINNYRSQLPAGAMGEMGIIRGEIGRKRGHQSIRKLVMQTGDVLQRIKPVFLMSPLSVAQYLPPGSVQFDLLVIDEASQVKPEDALGVIARAKQIVVVGDQKQLPPTSFFSRMGISEPDDSELTETAARAEEMESILSLSEARGLRSCMLEWHYRSKDPSLIHISNKEFYDGNLVLPPSPFQHDENYGLKFHQVAGVYSSSKSGQGRPSTNLIEATELVKEVKKHARDWPDLSLGIATFSKAQADVITEILDQERRRDRVLDSFMKEGSIEDVFVKNIENIQGDERDVIFISVGYGPHEPNGRLASMNFGPINKEGGERRLNVLFSRSRVKCSVFVSFDPEDINVQRTSQKGPAVLKRFLRYAKSGGVEKGVVSGRLPDSPLEEDVAKEIVDLGYQLDPQVGSGGFFIDIGVRNPDCPSQYLLAVECDGATYHSALWARERDRLRQDVLESLGWQFHRIWSTDWFYRRESEIEKLKIALTRARELCSEGLHVMGSNAKGAGVQIIGDIEPEPIEFDSTVLPKIQVPKYERSSFVVKQKIDPHLVPTSQLSKVVFEIVSKEGPIHTKEVSQRVANAFGKKRIGSRIVDATEKALHHSLTQYQEMDQSDGFWMTQIQKQKVPVRDRSDEAALKAEMIPPIEIRAAAELAKKECGTMAPEELFRAVANILGYKKLSPKLQSRFAEVLI